MSKTPKAKATRKAKPAAKAVPVPLDANDKVCGNCVYCNLADSTCRRSAPLPELSGNPKVIWPVVAVTDWCAEGYSYAMTWYEPAPRLTPRV